MSRVARLGVCGLSLAAAGMAAASGPVGAGDREEAGKEKKQIRVAHRMGGGYLGVQLEDVTSDDLARLKLDAERGAVVREVVEDSPAARAGLQDGDVILRYHGETVRSAAHLVRLVGETPSGRAVPLELSRDGAVQRLSVTLSQRKTHSWLKSLPDLDLDMELPEPPEPPEAPEAPKPPSRWMGDLLGRNWERGLHFGWSGPRRLGIGYQEISGQLARYFKLQGEVGVLVTEVEEDSPAAKAGIQAGDVMLAFDGKEIRDSDDLRRAVRDAEAGREVAAKVQREGRPLELGVTLADRERERERRRGVGI